MVDLLCTLYQKAGYALDSKRALMDHIRSSKRASITLIGSRGNEPRNVRCVRVQMCGVLPPAASLPLFRAHERRSLKPPANFIQGPYMSCYYLMRTTCFRCEGVWSRKELITATRSPHHVGTTTNTLNLIVRRIRCVLR